MAKKGVSRREFLRSAVGSMAAGVLGSLAFPAREAHAAPPDPNRVVVVHDDSVWLGGSTTNAEIDATRAADMVSTGLQQLTGQSTVADALQAIIPSTPAYSTAKVAIKVNFISNYLPTHQRVISPIIDGLLAIGFQGSNITIYDRHSQATNSGLSNETRVTKALPCSWVSAGQAATLTMIYEPGGSGGNTRTAYWAVPLYEADWQINMAVYKDHWTGLSAGGRTAVTLCCKNNLGSVDKSQYPCCGDDLVPLNAHAQLSPHWIGGMGGKCVLYVIDAIYGSITGNGPGNVVDVVPERLYFSCDPINIDYVGTDDMENIEAVDQPTPGHFAPGVAAGLGVMDLGKAVRVDMAGDVTPPDVDVQSVELKGTATDAGSQPVNVNVAGTDQPVNPGTGDWTSQDVPISSNPQNIPITTQDSSGNTAQVNISISE